MLRVLQVPGALLTAAALVLGLSAPTSVRAAAPAEDAGGEAEPAAEPEPADDAGGGEGEAEDEALTPQPEVEAVEEGPRPSGGGVAGAVVDPDDPNATRAQSDLEGESLDDEVEGVPERLPPLQAAGWWTTFGAITLASVGGVLAGVAEAREDQARRLADSFDLETGKTLVYADVADEYERNLREGRTYQNLARGFLVVGGVALVAGISLFIVEGVRRRRAEPAKPQDQKARLRLEPGSTGLRLRF